MVQKTIVGLGRARHDSSVCASINGVIKYAKYEREAGVKQAVAPEEWYWQKLFDWGVKKPDFICYTDETDLGSASRLPLNGEYYCKVKDNHYLLDHHCAHLWSNTNFDHNKQGVVIDGLGSGGHTVLIKSDKLYRSKSLSPAHLFHLITLVMKLSKPTHGNVAGKLMGLMSYGKPDYKLYEIFKTFDLDQIYQYCQNVYKTNNKEWWDILATINLKCYDYIKSIFNFTDKKKQIVYSGGAALNVQWNSLLQQEGYKLNIEPHVYDGGLSIGCVRWAHDFLKLKQPTFINFPYIQDDECPDIQPSEKTIKTIAQALSKGKLVGWYQGFGELGPRALGNRSILLDPRVKNGKDYLNEKVKFREWWRPYGASFLEKHAQYSPYMLYQYPLKNNYPAIKHVDHSCRHQTVNESQNFSFYKLIKEFYDLTGVPCLLNTSLNTKGKPIVGTIKEALKILKNTPLDILVVGDNIYYSDDK